MKIFILHNQYQRAGGEDAVVASEAQLLCASRTKHIHVEKVSNQFIEKRADKVRAFISSPYSSACKGWVTYLIAHHQPDVVHIHNFFPLLTPAVHEAASEAGVAVVQTLHNYRLICAGALLMRKGQVCETCVGANPVHAVGHRCYRDSVFGTLAVALMQMRAKRRQTWKRHVHRFIALTRFARDKFIQGGLPAERITVKPNFVSDLPGVNGVERRGALFVGRLSVEKGVSTLLEAWKKLPAIPLTIAGDGPERERLEATAPPGVRFLGRVPAAAVQAEMLKAQALIMPSQWYEGFPMTLAEAYAAGLPVIASRLGAMAELVVDGETGLLFPPGDPAALAATVRRAFADPARLAVMGAKARETCERLYTAERNLPMLEAIYREAIEEARAGRLRRQAARGHG